MPQHAVVTVVFEPEVPLLELQARSIARYVSTDVVSEIVVIDNTRRGLSRACLQALRNDLGARLTILRAREIAKLPMSGGWRRQQLLKLFVARLLEAERYVVLDAKNHFVGSLTPDFLVDVHGRPRLSSYSFMNHPHRPALERTLAFLGLPAEPRLARYTSTAPPFTFETQAVRELLDDLGGTRKQSFARTFLDEDLTEFFLYSAWREARGEAIDHIFDLSRPSCPTVWPRKTHLTDVESAISAASQPVFGIHRRALSHLPRASADALANFLAQRGLFESEALAGSWIVEATSAAARSRRDALSLLPARAVSSARRRTHRRVTIPRRP